MARARVYAVTGDAFAAIPLQAPGETRMSLDGSGACCLAVDPRDADRVYVGTFDDGVRVTEDGGETWRKSALDDPRVLSLAVSRAHEVHGRSVVYAGTEPSNLYRCDDGGRTWHVLPALRELPSEPRWSFPGRPWTHHVRTIALHPTDPEWLLVGIELGGVMRSTDGGATWADHNAQAHSDAHELLTHPLAPDRVYEAAGQGIAVSEDRGVTWSEREVGLDAATRGRRRSIPSTRTCGTSLSAAARSPRTAAGTARRAWCAPPAMAGPRSTIGATRRSSAACPTRWRRFRSGRGRSSLDCAAACS